MHLEKPKLAHYLNDPNLKGYALLQKRFFVLTAASQSAGEAFIGRLLLRTEDRESVSGPAVTGAQMAAFREREQFTGERFADLPRISQPTLVVNGVHDELIPVRNSYWLSGAPPERGACDHPDAGHGSLFQWHESFQNQAVAIPGIGLSVRSLLSTSMRLPDDDTLPIGVPTSHLSADSGSRPDRRTTPSGGCFSTSPPD